MMSYTSRCTLSMSMHTCMICPVAWARPYDMCVLWGEATHWRSSQLTVVGHWSLVQSSSLQILAQLNFSNLCTLIQTPNCAHSCCVLDTAEQKKDRLGEEVSIMDLERMGDLWKKDTWFLNGCVTTCLP